MRVPAPRIWSLFLGDNQNKGHPIFIGFPTWEVLGYLGHSSAEIRHYAFTLCNVLRVASFIGISWDDHRFPWNGAEKVLSTRLLNTIEVTRCKTVNVLSQKCNTI